MEMGGGGQDQGWEEVRRYTVGQLIEQMCITGE